MGAVTRSTTSIGDAVGAGAVPSHANKQWTIVSVVCRPPILRVGHQRVDVFFDGRQIKFVERLGVVELLAHWVSLERILVQDLQIQLVRPPVTVGIGSGLGGHLSAAAVHNRAFTSRFFCRLLPQHYRGIK